MLDRMQPSCDDARQAVSRNSRRSRLFDPSPESDEQSWEMMCLPSPRSSPVKGIVSGEHRGVNVPARSSKISNDAWCGRGSNSTPSSNTSDDSSILDSSFDTTGIPHHRSMRIPLDSGGLPTFIAPSHVPLSKARAASATTTPISTWLDNDRSRTSARSSADVPARSFVVAVAVRVVPSASSVGSRALRSPSASFIPLCSPPSFSASPSSRST
mmetsp:Transcript_15722/g.44908  ORF Transcript_15722/g.44908 Transcript_15722/m.44908 type:complete len:213 (+) Transcript_15722:269-907(+)